MVMKALLITQAGGEQVAKDELKELTTIVGKVIKEAVEFTFDDYEIIFTLSYLSQSALRIIVLDKPEDWLEKGDTFCVRAVDKETEIEYGNKISDKFKVNIKEPDLPLYVHKSKLGIDFTDELSKRSFRIFTHRQSLKGTTAFILLKEAGFKSDLSLLDPFAKDGTVILEAAHYIKHQSVRHFDKDLFNFINFKKFEDFDFEEFFEKLDDKQIKQKKSLIFAVSNDLRDISAIKKNSKIANINNFNISKLDIDWLDTKFKEKEIDLIVTFIPPKLPTKLLKEFYHQASFISKKTVLLTQPDFNYEDNNLKIESTKVVSVGKSELKIVFLKH